MMAIRTGRFGAYSVAAAAGVLGAGSLSLFVLFLFIGPFGLMDLRFGEGGVLSWDAALCLLFFLQHSGMVRKAFRARLNTVLPEHCHGVVYTAASGITLLLLVGAWQRSSTDIYVAAGAGRWVAGTVLLLALAGFVWGIRSLREFDAFGIRAFLSHVRRDERRPSKLTIEGPYRLIRHPFYGFTAAALWAAPALSLDRLLLNALFTAWIAFGATLEERDLVAEFGDDYRRYQRDVPMFLPRKAAWRRRMSAKHAGAGG